MKKLNFPQLHYRALQTVYTVQPQHRKLNGKDDRKQKRKLGDKSTGKVVREFYQQLPILESHLYNRSPSKMQVYKQNQLIIYEKKE